MALALPDLGSMAETTRAYTLAFVADLDDTQMMGPRLIQNPLLWEIAHVAWFMERWVFRRQGQASIVPGVDALYDSSAVAHETRWDIDLLPRPATLRYMRDVLDKVLDLLASGAASDEDLFHVHYAICHEQMHCEDFTRTRQLFGWPAPDLGRAPEPAEEAGPCPGDVDCPGGLFLLGADPDVAFAFDNEKWAHPVELAPFSIARAPVTQAQYAAFVEDEGYTRRELWCDDGWAWRGEAEHPVYWRRDGAGWARRHFDQWVPLEPHRPVCHVNWYEASAWCRWAGRRLPTEAEWEYAASCEGEVKHRVPWREGEGPCELQWRTMGTVDVGAHGASDSVHGCRQMLGNVWEWTADTFGPYPGFVPDPYADYSAPWFGTDKVLRGGSWATFKSLQWNTHRKFHEPQRTVVLAGFRTCACA